MPLAIPPNILSNGRGAIVGSMGGVATGGWGLAPGLAIKEERRIAHPSSQSSHAAAATGARGASAGGFTTYDELT